MPRLVGHGARNTRRGARGCRRDRALTGAHAGPSEPSGISSSSRSEAYVPQVVRSAPGVESTTTHVRRGSTAARPGRLIRRTRYDSSAARAATTFAISGSRRDSLNAFWPQAPGASIRRKPFAWAAVPARGSPRSSAEYEHRSRAAATGSPIRWAIRCPARRQPRRLRASAARRARVSPRHPAPAARRPGLDCPRAARSARRPPWRRRSGFRPDARAPRAPPRPGS